MRAVGRFFALRSQAELGSTFARERFAKTSRHRTRTYRILTAGSSRKRTRAAVCGLSSIPTKI